MVYPLGRFLVDPSLAIDAVCTCEPISAAYLMLDRPDALRSGGDGIASITLNSTTGAMNSCTNSSNAMENCANWEKQYYSSIIHTNI